MTKLAIFFQKWKWIIFWPNSPILSKILEGTTYYQRTAKYFGFSGKQMKAGFDGDNFHIRLLPNTFKNLEAYGPM